MAFQQGLRTLPLYDILATLLPGATVLIGLAATFGVDTLAMSGALAAVAFVVFGYLAGTILRWVGRQLEGRPVLFSNSRKLASGDITEDQITPRKNRWIETAFDGIPFYDSPMTSEKPVIHPTKIERSFEKYVEEEFDLDKEDQADIGSGKLLKILLSHLEITPHTRAIRFQAIHSFQRNTWAAMIVIFFATLGAIGKKWLAQNIGIPAPLDIAGIQSPSWGTLLLILISSLLLAFAFGELRNRFNQLFIEYVFTESYLDYTMKENADEE